MSVTARQRTIDLGLSIFDRWYRLPDWVALFAEIWWGDRYRIYMSEDERRGWVGDLTDLVFDVLAGAGIRCDWDVTASVLADATLRCGLGSTAGLAGVGPGEFAMPAHRAPRRALEFAVAALSLLEASENRLLAAEETLTRNYTRVIVAGGRDAGPEHVYELEWGFMDGHGRQGRQSP
jgi:hypothetical protein